MNTTGRRPSRRVARSALCVALCMALYATVPMVQAQTATATETVRQYDIPAGSLSSALGAWGAQSDRQVVYAPDLIAGKQSRGVSGRYSAEQALVKLLAGTGLIGERVSDQTYAIKRKPQPPTDVGQKRPLKPKASPSEADQKIATLDTVTVTGTRIRGGTTPSPVITIGSEQIQQEGFTNLGEVIRSIPQNFNGGQNPGVVNHAVNSQSDQNITGGSAPNLRGLGPDATLTLLNGRRMAYEGFSQGVDISALPVEAVDRIEIVPDGASAIYGSDAVGGVVNVILKPDYDGITIGARYGGATDGGLTTREYTATTGATWSNGGLIATWKKASNDPIYSDQRNYTKGMDVPTMLYPDAGLRSGLLSIHQSIGDNIEVHLDAFRTEREIFQESGYPTYYYINDADTTATMLSPSLDISLPHDWLLTIAATYGVDETDEHQPMVTSLTGAVSSDYRVHYRNKTNVYEIGAEGPLFSLPGGDARLAVGAGYRKNDFLDRDLFEGVAHTEGGDNGSRFGYAELNLPLIGRHQNITGLRRLEFTAAIRSEDYYNSFGRVTTPKFGVIYDPTANFTFKASWGKSFKAPTLLHQYQSLYAYLYPAATLGGTGYAADATALVLCCGRLNLNPTRARTSSASLAFHPEAIPGLEAELTWYHIDYTDHVVLPLGSAIYQALGSAAYAEFVDYAPKASEQAAILANSTAFYNYVGADYDPDKMVAIVDNRYINASKQKFKGVDLSGSYDMDIDHGRLIIRGSASWLDSKEQLTSAQSFHDLAGNIFYPAKVSGRMGATWIWEGFSTSAFANYKSGVTNAMDGVKSASFTTFDLTLRYDTGKRNDILSGLAFELSAQNLFDRAPPLYTVTSNQVAPYDSLNYSAIGRFVSVSVSKHW